MGPRKQGAAPRIWSLRYRRIKRACSPSVCSTLHGSNASHIDCFIKFCFITLIFTTIGHVQQLLQHHHNASNHTVTCGSHLRSRPLCAASSLKPSASATATRRRSPPLSCFTERCRSSPVPACRTWIICKKSPERHTTSHTCGTHEPTDNETGKWKAFQVHGGPPRSAVRLCRKP